MKQWVHFRRNYNTKPANNIELPERSFHALTFLQRHESIIVDQFLTRLKQGAVTSHLFQRIIGRKKNNAKT